jgi:putative transposase
MWRALQRAGIAVGRDRVARLMAGHGVVGATRSERERSTIAAPLAQRLARMPILH